MSTLGQVAAETTGIDPTALQFHSGLPVSDARTRYWAATRSWIDL